MIHQIKASNYLMALGLLRQEFFCSFNLKDGTVLTLFFSRILEKKIDDDLVGKKLHSKNSIHFCCQRNSIKRREQAAAAKNNFNFKSWKIEFPLI